MRIRDTFNQLDGELRQTLLTEYVRQGAKASGKAGESLRSEITDNKYTLFGAKHWLWIDEGRGVTRQAGDRKKRIESLYEWVGFRKYGITFDNDRQRLGIAYAIAKKQDNEGSFKFRNPSAKTNIVRKSITEVLPKFLNKLRAMTATSIRSDIKDVI